MLSPLRRLWILVSCLLVLASLAPRSNAQSPNVWTWHNDNNRTGWQQNEKILTQSNVGTSGQFGLLWQWPVKGSVRAQPLAVAGVQTQFQGCQPCDLIFVATQQDMLYAFKAGSGSQIWSLDLAGAVGGTAVDCSQDPTFPPCNEPSPPGPYVGVNGTPVTDATNNILYVVSAVYFPGPGTVSYYLLAVNITSGQRTSSTTITGSVPGQAPSMKCKTSSGQGTVTFDSNHIQRASLLQINPGGPVYVAFAPLPEKYNGWLFGYQLNGSTLSQTVKFNTTPYGTGGGIWQAGAAPASDGTYIYLSTGNGTFDLEPPATPLSVDAGDSLLKLNPSNLAIVDYYTPSNVFTYDQNQGLCANDIDFGSGGVMLFPDAFYNGLNLAVKADKQSNLYVTNVANMGKYNVNGGNNVQTILTPCNYVQGICQGPLDPSQGYWASPAYWKYTSGSTTNYMLYYSATVQPNTPTEASEAPLPVNGYQLLTSGTPVGPIPSQYLSTTTLFCYPSPTPSVSSNPNALISTGIVWAIENQNKRNPTDCAGSRMPAALHAFNATSLAPLYSSGNLSTKVGLTDKFPVPTIFKGYVYMGTQTEVDVFGLCGNPNPTCAQ